MPHIEHNERLQAVDAPFISTGWITSDLKENGYAATLMADVIKPGVRDVHPLELERAIRRNRFTLQFHLTRKQIDVLVRSLQDLQKDLDKRNETVE